MECIYFHLKKRGFKGPSETSEQILLNYPLAYLPAYFSRNYLVNCLKVLSGLVGKQVRHLISSSHLCVVLTLTSGNAEDLSQYEPGC